MKGLHLWWFGVRVRWVAVKFWARTGFGWPAALEETKQAALRALLERKGEGT